MLFNNRLTMTFQEIHDELEKLSIFLDEKGLNIIVRRLTNENKFFLFTEVKPGSWENYFTITNLGKERIYQVLQKKTIQSENIYRFWDSVWIKIGAIAFVVNASTQLFQLFCPTTKYIDISPNSQLDTLKLEVERLKNEMRNYPLFSDSASAISNK